MSQPGKGSAGKPHVSQPISDKGEASKGSVQKKDGLIPPASVPGKGTKGTGKSF